MVRLLVHLTQLCVLEAVHNLQMYVFFSVFIKHSISLNTSENNKPFGRVNYSCQNVDKSLGLALDSLNKQLQHPIRERIDSMFDLNLKVYCQSNNSLKFKTICNTN